MVDRHFEPGGPSRLQLKDLNAVAAMAEAFDLTLPLTVDIRQAFEAFVADGNGELDHSALLLHLEQNNRRGAADD
jgi:2-hydroxy-3-oxopropionate reductase